MAYYPVDLVASEGLLSRYVNRVREETDVAFFGRLTPYRCQDMDVAIKEALHATQAWIERRKEHL